ncbi:MAG: ABC transporter permease [Planctomycetota bacterium]|nr:ABC transporter permease [Planctomycetota bacterium]
MARKDLRLLLRDKAGFFFTFFFPLIFAVFFGSIFGGIGSESASMKVVVVDEDQTEGSRAFIEELKSTEGLDISLASREEAVRLVRQGKQTAYVILPKEFGKSRQRMFWEMPPDLELGVDPARKAEGAMLEGILTQSLFKGMGETFQNPKKLQARIKQSLLMLRMGGTLNPDQKRMERFLKDLDLYLEELPEKGEGAALDWNIGAIKKSEIKEERSGPKNPFSISFPQAIIWGILGCVATFAVSLVTERSRGTLIRLRIAPIRRVQIIAGKGVACFVTTVLMSTVLLLLGAFVFDVRPASIPLLAMAVVSVSIGFVGIMMFLSVLGKTEAAAGGMGWAILTLFSMMGGGMMPLFFMPSWMQTVSHISPVKWAILALEGPIWRGFSFAEMITPCAILIGVGIVFFAVGTKAFRWTEQS